MLNRSSVLISFTRGNFPEKKNRFTAKRDVNHVFYQFAYCFSSTCSWNVAAERHLTASLGQL